MRPRPDSHRRIRVPDAPAASVRTTTSGASSGTVRWFGSRWPRCGRGYPPDQWVLRAGSLRECVRGPDPQPTTFPFEETFLRDHGRVTTDAYTANVPDDRSGVKVRPTVNATVKVNGTSVPSGSLSGEIAVAFGANRIGVPL